MRDWCVMYYDIEGRPCYRWFGSRLNAHEFADIVGGYVLRGR